MATFALSCFGLLLFLWSAFGGPVPLRPHGYQFTTSFGEATQLAQEADVRISGVPVGKVKKIQLGGDGRSEAMIELDDRYAPLRSDARAILRQKTLLGETYVELTPGTKGAPPVPESGKLPASRVSPTVELDEILRALDRKTRESFQAWMQSQAQGVRGRGADLSDAFGYLHPFAENTNEVLAILNSQQRATRQLVRNTGEVFAALTERDGVLRDWIENSNLLWRTTAQRDRQLKETFIALPTFIDESKRTLRRLEAYADNTNPLITRLHPFARELSSSLVNAKGFAPELKGLFVNLDAEITASKRGFPALSQFLDDLRPLLGQLDPFLRNLNPMLDYLGLYKRELTAFFANDVAVTQAANELPGTQKRLHYLRLSTPVSPESLAIYPRKLGSNRSNPYLLPGAFDKLRQGLEVFNETSCANGGYPDLAPPSQNFSEDLRNRILKFFFGDSKGIAIPCRQQGKFSVGGESSGYPHVREAPLRP